MIRWAIVGLLLIVVALPALRLAGSFDTADHLAVKHVRSAAGGWRHATLAPRIADELPAPAESWWSLVADSAGGTRAVSSTPFVPPRAL